MAERKRKEDDNRRLDDFGMEVAEFLTTEYDKYLDEPRQKMRKERDPTRNFLYFFPLFRTRFQTEEFQLRYYRWMETSGGNIREQTNALATIQGRDFLRTSMDRYRNKEKEAQYHAKDILKWKKIKREREKAQLISVDLSNV